MRSSQSSSYQSPASSIMALLRRVALLIKPAQINGRLLIHSSLRRFLFVNSSTMNVADLSDAYSDTLQYVEANFLRNYGGKAKFGGMISTLKCHEDNVLVKKALTEPGNKRVSHTTGQC